MMGIGKRYTDGPVDKLYKDLSTKKHKLYCWDTERLDRLYHSQIGRILIGFNVPTPLKGIARDISTVCSNTPIRMDLVSLLPAITVRFWVCLNK